MREITKKIDRLIGINPEKRINSDKLLQIAVWREEGLNLTSEQEAIFLEKCTIAETITRARRHIQTKYLKFMHPAVIKARHLQEIAHKYGFGHVKQPEPLPADKTAPYLEEPNLNDIFQRRGVSGI